MDLLPLSPDIDPKKQYGTANPKSTTLLGAYSALPLRFGPLVVSAPAEVLLNQNYNLLIGTAFMKQFGVKTCNKEDKFTRKKFTLPIYYKVKPEWTQSSFNLVYNDCLVPVEYSTESQNYRSAPLQVYEYNGFALKAHNSFIIPFLHQKICDTCIKFFIPSKLNLLDSVLLEDL